MGFGYCTLENLGVIRVVLLGATGFFGRHLAHSLRHAGVDIITAGRGPNSDISLDLSNVGMVHFPDVDFVINAAAYGVVRHQQNLETMMQVNYLGPAKVAQQIPAGTRWIQIGTAFEYDLDVQALSETTRCVPKTSYGISKWLMSHYLETLPDADRWAVIRPFAMFGPYEEESKLIPLLILSQARGESVALSAGTQERDYVYVGDVADWLARYIIRLKADPTLPQIVNVGGGNPISLRWFADQTGSRVPGYKAGLWRWGELSSRPNEPDRFYNASRLVNTLGFVQRPFSESIRLTIDYYFKATKNFEKGKSQ